MAVLPAAFRESETRAEERQRGAARGYSRTGIGSLLQRGTAEIRERPAQTGPGAEVRIVTRASGCLSS